MPLPFFENSINSGTNSGNPNSNMRDMLQAYVDSEWDNTTALQNIQEQVEIGSTEYQPVEAMIANVTDLITSGLKVSRDFMKVFFRDFSHPVIKGKYYKFDNCYWIVDDVSLYEGVAPLISLRRCNNALRIIDPITNSIFSAPCVINYDMTSPTEQVSKYILTPNNHAEVTVQANDDTIRLFIYNKRFILGGRPFKLLSYQNTLLHDKTLEKPTVLYLDLYLDEIHAEDDIENSIADNIPNGYDYGLMSIMQGGRS